MILIKGIRFRRIEAIALWPFVLVKSQNPSQRTLRHEKIHLRQQLEMLILPFYLWYVFEWMYKWWKLGDADKAYFEICFEREAYKNEDEPHYLNLRKFWNFTKYL